MSILEHVAKPPIVSNCSRAELICTVNGSDSVVAWSFHGENAADLPDTQIERDQQQWRLIIRCATIRHAGTYVCSAHARNNKNLISRKDAALQVYGRNLYKIVQFPINLLFKTHDRF